MMILGLISQELHQQLLDRSNYLTRITAVDELSRVLSEADLKSVPSASMDEFIQFLGQLLDDSNFKVFYGTLKVIHLLVRKLDTNLEKYFKQITLVAMKALGDALVVIKTEYMKVFQQLMGSVGAHKVLDLTLGSLSHKKARVREDALNIITAAMLIHPRREFNICKLCLEAAPCLADGKRNVRHAALELFAMFDYCLDTGKKQPLTKAVDMVELNEDVEGLMAAVQARRARHTLPGLSPEGIVEYALVVPKPGQRCSPQCSMAADLEWVLHGGRVSSARSYRDEPDGSDQLFSYSSSGFLTDDLLPQRRISSAGKRRLLNGKSSDKIASEDDLYVSRRSSPNTYVQRFASEVTEQRHSGRRRESPTRLRRSGSLDLDPDVFKSIHCSESHSVMPKGCLVPGNPGVEPSRALLADSNTRGSFLLPSYPLAGRPGGLLTPTRSRRQVDSSVSWSNTGPNEEGLDLGPWRDTTGKGKGEQTSGSKCSSPRPLRATLVSSSTSPLTITASSYRRALSSMKAARPASPVLPGMERSQSHNGQQRSSWRGSNPELGTLGSGQRLQDDESLDMEEMLNSLHKKRAKVSLSDSEQDLDSPDSAVRLELGLDSPSHSSPTVTSPASESGLSSLCSPPNCVPNGANTRYSPRYSVPSKQHDARVPSAKLKSLASMDCDHTIEASPPLDRATFRQPMRVTRPINELELNSITTHTTGSGRAGSPVAVDTPTSLSSPLGSPRCLGSPHQPRPPTVPPSKPKTTTRLRRAVSVTQAQPSLSKTTDELSQGALGQKRDLTEPRPIAKPELALTQSLRLISSDDWEKKIEGLTSLCGLAHNHADTLLPQLHDICMALIQEVRNLRSGVSRAAVCALGTMYSTLQCHMDRELDGTAQALLHKAGETGVFLRQDVDTALGHMVQHCTPVRCLHAFLVGGMSHLNAAVRKCCSEHLAHLLEKVGVDRLLSGGKELTDRLLPAVVRVSQDSSQEVRYFGRRMLLFLSSHWDFDKILAKYISAKDLAATRDLVSTLRTKGLGEMPQDLSSARRRRSLPGSGTTRALPLTREALKQTGSGTTREPLKQTGSGTTREPLKQTGSGTTRALPLTREALKQTGSGTTREPLKQTGSGTTREPLKQTGSGTTREPLKQTGSGTTRASPLTREPLKQTGSGTTRATNSAAAGTTTSRESNSQNSLKSAGHSIADKTEYVKQLLLLLESKDFRERIEGIDQLVADCQTNSSLVIYSLFPVFDAFKARLEESNSKVNLHALKSLQKIVQLLKDNMSQVVNILVPAIVDNHLNSRNAAIYSAATDAISELMLNVDNILLLQPFCTKAQFLGGRAKVDLILNIAELVTVVYPCRPQMVKQKALPLLWYLLGSSGHSGTMHGRGSSVRDNSVRSATTHLCQALHDEMGPSLAESATFQLPTVQRGLNDILRNLS